MLLAALIAVSFFNSTTWACHSYQTADNYRKDKAVTINDKQFSVEVPDSSEARMWGLSGRPCIGDDQAMLFVFEEAGVHCFWMKEMQFFIDIVWLDADKRIIYVKENADPASYPKHFCPPSPAKYVLEFSAGTAQRLGLASGQQLSF